MNRWLGFFAGCLLSTGLHGVAAAAIVPGSCNPSFVGLGAFDTQTVVPVQAICTPEHPLAYDPTTLVASEGVGTYEVSIQFELLSSGSFGGYLSFNGTFSYFVDPLTGVMRVAESSSRYVATVLYEDSPIAFIGCGGCAGGRPALVNSVFFAGAIPGQAADAVFVPAGTYRIEARTIVNSGPVGDRWFNMDLSLGPRGDTVTPVPEPATTALQAIGLGALALALLRLRRRPEVASLP